MNLKLLRSWAWIALSFALLIGAFTVARPTKEPASNAQGTVVTPTTAPWIPSPVTTIITPPPVTTGPPAVPMRWPKAERPAGASNKKQQPGPAWFQVMNARQCVKINELGKNSPLYNGLKQACTSAAGTEDYWQDAADNLERVQHKDLDCAETFAYTLLTTLIKIHQNSPDSPITFVDGPTQTPLAC
ncbi:hypothetical protein [Actinocorallia longicatena]|uniref:Uncharacterized protein n=1 Tax=Actinocorallia longicatena TaxID=111803 RepID=A0ABP6QIQ2_9ACTN